MFAFKKLLFVGVLLSSLVGNADEIILAADVWPPFVGKPNSDKPGYMVEVARKVFAAKGHTVIYKEVPWSRAVKTCRKGEIPGILGAAVGDAPDFIFPSESLGKLENYNYVLKDSNWKFTGIDSYKNVVIGVIQDYDYGEEMNKYLTDNKGSKKIQYVSGNDPLEKNIKKLKAKRIDVLVECKPVFEDVSSSLGMADLFKSAGADGKADPVYIAFSPANKAKSEEYAKILSEGIIELRKSGELAKILKKYGQNDWK